MSARHPKHWAAIAATVCMALVTLGCPARPSPPDDPAVEPEPLPAGAWPALRHATAVLGSVADQLRGLEGEARSRAARAALSRTSPWPERQDLPGAAVVGYARARLQLIAGDPQAAREQVPRLLATPEVAPEALFVMVEAAGRAGDAEGRRRGELWLGKALPLSPYGILSDRSQTQRLGSAEGPVIPDLRREKLIEVARLYTVLGDSAAAERAYREAIYGGFGPPWAAEERRATWLSEEALDLWLAAADVQLATGRGESAAGSAARVLVYGGAQQRAAAADLLGRLERGDRPPVQASSGERPVDGERILQMARLYAAMNLHPRAIALLRHHRTDLPAAAAALEQRLVDEWRQLLRTHCATVAGPCVLFGHDVTALARPEEIEIPGPAAPAALAEVAAALEREAAQEPPR